MTSSIVFVKLLIIDVGLIGRRNNSGCSRGHLPENYFANVDDRRVVDDRTSDAKMKRRKREEKRRERK